MIIKNFLNKMSCLSFFYNKTKKNLNLVIIVILVIKAKRKNNNTKENWMNWVLKLVMTLVIVKKKNC